jgi:FtsP/CotA-like multicopper oxidase with cupredoxin domain
MSLPVNFKVGSLFPKTDTGELNIILSDGLTLTNDGSSQVIISKTTATGATSAAAAAADNLTTGLNITSNPIKISGVSKFLSNYFIPQITDKNISNNNSLFSQWFQLVSRYYSSVPRNETIKRALTIGYDGKFKDNAATNDEFFNQNGDTNTSSTAEIIRNAELKADLADLSKYNPSKLWALYKPTDETISSDFDTKALLDNLNNIPNADLWYPSLLYTYSDKNGQPSYPGPVLMIDPGAEGSKINLNITNNITIDGLTQEQVQKATLVPNNSYGLNTSDGLGGTSSTNFHLHGGHVYAGGFSDNVVSRYTAGQSWTTSIDFLPYYPPGSLWYHPHYHPAVNQQVYGGLTGFMQVGDPLSKIPYFKDIPRNIAILKTANIGIDPATGKLLLDAFDSNWGAGNTALTFNRMQMVTVNGEYQPQVQLAEGGWQAITISNEDNNFFFNISLVNTSTQGVLSKLPLYIYGEDGEQYPQITAVEGTLGLNQPNPSLPPIGYSKAEDTINVPSGKRVDLLFYLPEGKTELQSTYKFTTANGTYVNANQRFPANQYPDYSLANSINNSPTSSPGPLAIFDVPPGTPQPSEAFLNSQITIANQGIKIQEVSPDTRIENPDAVASINLFATDTTGKDIWQPIRKREFNFSILALVGPKEEYDQATQQMIAANNLDYQRYSLTNSYLSQITKGPSPNSWLGYDRPDLINDHVFPNGNLIVAQIGTIEEWRLRNWSWSFNTTPLFGINNQNDLAGPSGYPSGGYYAAHPFHIHVNNFQVKSSDNELNNKRNLQDTVMLNSSGYKFYFDSNTNDSTPGQVVSLDSLAPGTFHPLPEASDPSKYKNLYTGGADDTTVKMAFQDYIGTYVMHCHMLEHEDAGMMQTIKVINNTKNSWLAPTQGFINNAEGIQVRRANDFTPFYLKNTNQNAEIWQRMVFSDVTSNTADFHQDIILSGQSNGKPGQVAIYDGIALAANQTKQLSSITPYQNSYLAPYVQALDFTGDNQNDIITAGFTKVKDGGIVSIHSFAMTLWLNKDNARTWEKAGEFIPYDLIPHHGYLPASGSAISTQPSVDHSGMDHSSSAATGQVDISPLATLTADQVAFTAGDFNLDNFNDFALSYAINGGIRITILDGAALSLAYQTGKLEGGYLPNSNILADSVILDSELNGLSQIVLTTGFNSYAQGVLENLIITTQSSTGTKEYTLGLQVGHFIATSEANGHTGHATPLMKDDRLVNLGPFPLNFIDQLNLPVGTAAATPVFSGPIAQGTLLIGDQLAIAQGNGYNGNKSNSNNILNSTQQLIVQLDGLREVNRQDLLGVTNTNFDSIIGPTDVRSRNQLTAMLYQAYTGEWILPSLEAAMSASVLGTGGTPTDLAATILMDPLLKPKVDSFYGGDISKLSTAQIVTSAIKGLYQREATVDEIWYWDWFVDAGYLSSKSYLPLAILQSTESGTFKGFTFNSNPDLINGDVYKVALSSASQNWSQALWSTSANVSGSFGQGFQDDTLRYNVGMNNILSNQAPLASWQNTQSAFDTYQTLTLNQMSGTQVSPRGPF